MLQIEALGEHPNGIPCYPAKHRLVTRMVPMINDAEMWFEESH